MNDTGQIIGDLVLIEIGRRNPDIHRRELRVRSFQIDNRDLSFWRKIVANLRHFRLDLGERRRRVIVDFQVHQDRAQPLRAGRLHVIDAVGAGDNPLDRRRDETANQISARAHIYRRDLHDRNVAARILTHTQRTDGLQTGDQDHQIYNDRQHGTLNE